jgi:hypothetical protein
MKSGIKKDYQTLIIIDLMALVFNYIGGVASVNFSF